MKRPTPLQLNPQAYEFQFVAVDQGKGLLPSILVRLDSGDEKEIIPNHQEAKRIGEWLLKFAAYSKARSNEE